jgi:hypothetical protein
MTGLDTAMIILSLILALGSGITYAASSRASKADVAKKIIADASAHGAIIRALQAPMNDRYTKQQTEVVARVVWRYSSVPLRAVLKDSKERYNVYRGLSDPNQYPWDTPESDFLK